jgi:hypothetical protein
MKKPIRRPKRCITAESQGAVVIEPKTISEIGIVASAGEGAIISPASPPITKIMGIWLPRMACARTSTATLRFARRSSPSRVCRKGWPRSWGERYRKVRGGSRPDGAAGVAGGSEGAVCPRTAGGSRSPERYFWKDEGDPGRAATRDGGGPGGGGGALLVTLEPRFGPVVAAGPLPLRRRADGFAALLSAIVAQQVSTASAAAIWGRVAAAGLDREEAWDAVGTTC